MDATKEEARKAARIFRDYRRRHGAPADELADAIDFFLLAAIHQLPTNADYRRNQETADWLTAKRNRERKAI